MLDVQVFFTSNESRVELAAVAHKINESSYKHISKNLGASSRTSTPTLDSGVVSEQIEFWQKR